MNTFETSSLVVELSDEILAAAVGARRSCSFEDVCRISQRGSNGKTSRSLLRNAASRLQYLRIMPRT